MKRTIGVLALQGGFASHISVLQKLGTTVREIRKPTDLSGCDGLVIPGGESTVMTKLLLAGDSSFYPALRTFSLKFPVMGTCAGLIILARPCGDERVVSLDVLPVSIERNSYGRQTESFIEPIQVHLGGNSADDRPFRATFIRAPRISAVDENVQVLAHAKGDPVMVRFGHLLGLTFHPELTPNDPRIHEYFLTLEPLGKF